jgi:hypothetical protein
LVNEEHRKDPETGEKYLASQDDMVRALQDMEHEGLLMIDENSVIIIAN